jgi:hypothetical protein
MSLVVNKDASSSLDAQDLPPPASQQPGDTDLQLMMDDQEFVFSDIDIGQYLSYADQTLFSL